MSHEMRDLSGVLSQLEHCPKGPPEKDPELNCGYNPSNIERHLRCSGHYPRHTLVSRLVFCHDGVKLYNGSAFQAKGQELTGSTSLI